jgi:peroxiredoxin
MRLEPRVVPLLLALCVTPAAAQLKDSPRPQAPDSNVPHGEPQFQNRISGDVVVGELAPDFVLDGSFGRPVQLSAYRGKWLILVFGDRKEIVAPMRDVAAPLDSSGIALLGICNEKAYFLEAFSRQSRFPFPILADVTREISAMYGLEDARERTVQPGFILIEPNGSVRFALLGETLPPTDVARLARWVAARP